MANPTGKGGKRFEKGKSGNPAGGPKLPEDIRKAAQVTNEQFIRITSEYLLMDRATIQDRLQNPKASMLELIIGGIVAKGAKDHEEKRTIRL